MISLETMVRKSRPFVMRGPPIVTEERETIHHPADSRVPTVYPERALTASELRMMARDTALDPRLRAIDRYLWRWAVGHGTGLPPEDPDVLRHARPSPLPAADAIRTDELIQDLPPWARSFLFMWFRSNMSIEQIAERLECRPRAVYDYRREVLFHVLGYFRGKDVRIPTWEST